MGLVRQENSNMNTVTPTVNGHGAEFENPFPDVISEEPVGKTTAPPSQIVMLQTVTEIGLSSRHEPKIENCTLTKRSAPEMIMKNNNEQTNFCVKGVRDAHLEKLILQNNSRKKTGPCGSDHNVASSVGNPQHAINYQQNTAFSSVTKVKVTPIVGNGNSVSCLKEVNEEPGAHAQTEANYATSVSLKPIADDMLKCSVNKVKLRATSVNATDVACLKKLNVESDKNVSKNVTHFVGSESKNATLDNVITVNVRQINLNGNDSTCLKHVDGEPGENVRPTTKSKPSQKAIQRLELNSNSFHGQGYRKEVNVKPAYKILNLLPQTDEEPGPNLCHDGSKEEAEDCVDGIIVGVQELRVSPDNENEKTSKYTNQSKPVIRERGPKRNRSHFIAQHQESNRPYPSARLPQSLPSNLEPRVVFPESAPVSSSLPPSFGRRYDYSVPLFNSSFQPPRADRRTYALASGGGITVQSSNDTGLTVESQRISPITIPIELYGNNAPDSEDSRSTGSESGLIFGNMSPMGSENSSPLHSSESTGNAYMEYGTLQSLSSNISSGSSTLLASSPYEGAVGESVPTNTWNNYPEPSHPFLNVATTQSSAPLFPTLTASSLNQVHMANACETAESILNSICANTITTNVSQTDSSNFVDQFLNYTSTENVTFIPSSTPTVSSSSEAFGLEHVDQAKNTDNLDFDPCFIQPLLNFLETEKSASVSSQNEADSMANSSMNSLPAFSKTFSSRKKSDTPNLITSVENAPIMTQINIRENPSENDQSNCSYNPLTSNHSYTSEAMLDLDHNQSVNNFLFDSQYFLEVPVTLHVVTEASSSTSSNLVTQTKVQEVESFGAPRRNSKDLTASFANRQPSPASSLSDHAYSQSPSRSSCADLMSPYTDTTYLSSGSGTPASVHSENSPISATSQESDEFLNSPKEVSSFDSGNIRTGIVSGAEKAAAVKKIVDSLKEVESNPNPSASLRQLPTFYVSDLATITTKRVGSFTPCRREVPVPILPKPNTVPSSGRESDQRTMDHVRHNSGSTRSKYYALVKKECNEKEVRSYCEKYSVGDKQKATLEVDSDGNTALQNALKQKSQPCAVAIHRLWSRHYASIKNGELEYKRKINHQNKNGETAVLLAIANGYVNFVGYLLEENKADSTLTDLQGNTVFHYAARTNKAKETIELLCKLDSCPAELITRQNKKGETPLSIVVSQRGGDHREKLELVKLLLMKQTRLDIQDEEGKTALHRAIQLQDDVELVRVLLNFAPHESGTLALSMKEHKHGYTPLHMVATLSNASIQKELAQILIVRNESIRTIRDSYQKCPYELVDSSRKEVLELMMPRRELFPWPLVVP